MALTFTKQVALGFQAPDFKLPDVVSGKMISYNDIKGEKIPENQIPGTGCSIKWK